jgi:hypothetical protein
MRRALWRFRVGDAGDDVEDPEDQEHHTRDDESSPAAGRFRQRRIAGRLSGHRLRGRDPTIPRGPLPVWPNNTGGRVSMVRGAQPPFQPIPVATRLDLPAQVLGWRAIEPELPVGDPTQSRVSY